MHGVLEVCADGVLAFYCPACNNHHGVHISGEGHPVWGFNGDYEAPTFTPSVRVRGRTFTPAGLKAFQNWLDAGSPQPAPKFEAADTCCHFFVTNGALHYCTDCTHSLAGKSAKLEPIP